jgi:hypothetical protein
LQRSRKIQNGAYFDGRLRSKSLYQGEKMEVHEGYRFHNEEKRFNSLAWDAHANKLIRIVRHAHIDHTRVELARKKCYARVAVWGGSTGGSP